MRDPTGGGGTGKRFLVITHRYAPVVDPCAFRWGAVCRQWAAQGHRVDVVAARDAGLPAFEVLDGVRVHRVGGLATRGHSQLRVLQGDPLAGASGPAAPRRAGRVLADAAKWVYDRSWKKVYWPDYATLWRGPAARKARALAAEGDFDGMVSVSLPFSGHAVGHAVHRTHPDLPWVLENSDPFGFLDDTPANNLALYRGRNRAYERRLFARADASVVPNEGLRALYAEHFPESADRLRIIPHLLDAGPPAPGTERFFPADGTRRLYFAGALFRTIRNPEYLLRLFERIVADGAGPRVELHLFGRFDDCADLIEPFRARLGDALRLHGLVEKRIAVQAMWEADVLVNLGNRTAHRLPSKVVEYAATGKPVLNLAPGADDSSLAFFRDYPAALSLVEGAEGEGAQARRMAEFARTAQGMDAGPLQDWLEQFRIAQVAAEYEALLVAGRR